MMRAMYTHLDTAAIPRQPSQARSRERFEKVIQAADTLLENHGLHGFSIPALAESLGMTRRSIYLFFPTPYAVLNEVTRRYIEKLQTHLTSVLAALSEANVVESLARATFAAADFQNNNPVGRLLMLGGAVTDHSYRAQEMNIRQLGSLARQVLQDHGCTPPPAPPDSPTLAVELGTACFRHSFAYHGVITPAYKLEAAYVMLMYLSPIIDLPKPPTRIELQQFL